MTNKPDIAALKELLEELKVRPWFARPNSGNSSWTIEEPTDDGGLLGIATVQGAYARDPKIVEGYARLIAAAVNALPALLAGTREDKSSD
jgi:hypothetical protein